MRRFQRAIALAALPLCACATLPVSTLAPNAPATSGATRYQLLAATPLAPTAVTADSQLSTNPAKNAADGNTSSFWANAGYLAATGWVRLQFASDATMGSVGVRMPPSAAGTSYDLQVSLDGTTWTTALSGQTSGSWNVETKTLPAGTHGKYLRLFWHNSTSSAQPHVNVYEITVSGTATGSPAPSTAPSTKPSTAPSSTPTPMPSGSTGPAPTYPNVANPGAHAAAGMLYNNGKPVSGIAVQVTGPTTKNLTTDASGRYSVTGLPDGSYQAYYYNPSDRNKIGYWRSQPVTVNGSQGAAFPTIDLYLQGQINHPTPNSRVALPANFQWLGPIQPVVGYYYRVHSEPYTSFQLVFQSAKLTGNTFSYTWDGSNTKTGPLDPSHRYFWGVQWDWGGLGQGGNLYQAVYFN